MHCVTPNFPSGLKYRIIGLSFVDRVMFYYPVILCQPSLTDY